MSLISLLFIAIGLSMDAFAVSVTNGISIKNLRNRDAIKIALFMGGFQGIMPLIGWVAGIGFKDYITKYDHWIALILLSIIGGKMIYESVKELKENSRVNKDELEVIVDKEDKEVNDKQRLNNKVLLLLAIATSIDALAVGVSFAFLDINIVGAALIIGITTYIISFIGVKIGKKCGVLFKNKAEIAGGILLILIGVKILLEHIC